MFKIYCLLDPSTKEPFYVGITRHCLQDRLRGHIRDAVFYSNTDRCIYFREKKGNFINKILKSGLEPKILLLMESDMYSVSYYEYFFYKQFITQGYKMLQGESRFYYAKSHATKKFKVRKDKTLLPVLIH